MSQDNAVQAEGISEAEAEAAFNAGMNQVRGDRAPVNEEVQEKAAEAKAKREAKAEPVQGDHESQPVGDANSDDKAGTNADDKPAATADVKADESEKEEPRFAGLKESEVKALLAKAAEVDTLKDQMQKLHDRTAGKIGSLSQALKDLQNRPTAKATKVAADQLKSLSKDFPELASRLAEDLSTLELGGGAAAALVDPEAIAAMVETKLADIQFKADVKRLDTTHPDRQQVVASDAYKTWFALQPSEAQNMIRTSRSADFAISAFNAFKQWRDRDTEVATQQEDAAKAAKQRDKRLADAMTPTGTASDNGKKVLTPDEEFNAGVMKVRGNRR